MDGLDNTKEEGAVLADRITDKTIDSFVQRHAGQLIKSHRTAKPIPMVDFVLEGQYIPAGLKNLSYRERARIALKSGADLNAGEFPSLTYAAVIGDPVIMEMVLKGSKGNGVNLRAPRDGWSAIVWYARSKHVMLPPKEVAAGIRILQEAGFKLKEEEGGHPKGIMYDVISNLNWVATGYDRINEIFTAWIDAGARCPRSLTEVKGEHPVGVLRAYLGTRVKRA